jgi:triosephosphate isomerase (TIM)
MRRRICAGNWKMNKTTSETRAYIDRFAQLAPSVPEYVELVICPPFTSLQAAHEALAKNDRIKLGAQDVHWEKSGAFTGAISAPMLLDLGVQYAIVGHSERRQYFGDTDETVARKAAAALEYGLTPVIAVGESLDIRRAGNAERHVIAQTLAALERLDTDAVRRVVLAYEPIWAIGTGENCDAAAANEIMHAMRECRDGLQDVPILYGGSVKPDNIVQYVAQPDIDGGLVGGASLDPDDFAKLAIGAA